MIKITDLTGPIAFIIEDNATGNLQLIQGTRKEILEEYHNGINWAWNTIASIRFIYGRMIFEDQSYYNLTDLIRDLEW